MSSENPARDKTSNGNIHDEDSTKSRTRVSRACTRCRTRKDKCDGLRPSCTACINVQQPCYYEPSTKKRGLPEGYVRGLEKLLALLMGKVKGFETVTSSLLKDNRQQLSKIWNHAVVGEELHSIWKDSDIITELETLLSGLDQSAHSASHKRKRDRDDDGVLDDPDSDTTFHITPKYEILENLGSTKLPDAATSQFDKVPAFPQQALQLLDQYFAHTNCWFPILRRPDLTRACYEMARGHATTSNQAMSPLLWAVFAYAAKQRRSIEYAHEDQNSPEEMYRISLSLLPTDAETWTLVHAQALLVLCLFDIGNNFWKSAWTLIGKAVRIVLTCLSSHKDADKITVATLQGCVVLDVVAASHLHCIPHLRKHDLELIPRMAEDGHEEWEPWNGPDGFRGQREPSFSFSCFNRLTEVFLIVGEALQLPSPSQSMDKHHVQGLLAKLHELQGSFPGQMPPFAQSPPHQIYLQLCHVSAQMYLVELPVDTGARSHERAKLACNVLSVLALCKNAPAITLAHVPPFCYNGIAAALRLASMSTDSFGPAAGLPSYQDFLRTSNEYIRDLSSVWPLFRTLNVSNPVFGASISRSDPSMSLIDEDILSPVGGGKHQRLRNGSSVRGERTSVGQHGINSLPVVNDDMTSPWILPGNDGSNTAKSAEDGLVPANLESVPDSRLLDRYLEDHRTPGSTSLAVANASPNFHGDEIDAIFHEMAHLDTNDWTNERVTGLKDFGFDDDLTFQAFCNDPDRLAGTENNGRTLSSSLQTWMFTGDPG